jgi:hypothetical protein
MIFISKYIVPRGYTGIALFPFVILKHKALMLDAVLINHEKIHIRQQLEMLVLPFYLMYIIEFSIRLVLYRNWKNAYKNISFECEAFTNEKDLEYLKTRSFWNFLNYL